MYLLSIEDKITLSIKSSTYIQESGRKATLPDLKLLLSILIKPYLYSR